MIVKSFYTTLGTPSFMVFIYLIIVPNEIIMLIIKFEHAYALQKSKEGVKIQKIASSISPVTFIKLLKFADNKVNPRTASINPITKSIYETLETSPELFWLKTKGILLSSENCEQLDRNRVKISLNDSEYEGIMDGGHNTFAIAQFLIEKLFGVSVKKWDDCKAFWKDNYEEILLKTKEHESLFSFSIPVEIISPSEEEGALDEFYDYIAEICAARNNNVQLKETTKGNQVGHYDYLKTALNDYDISWRTGEPGKIKSEDVISLSTLPLIFLKTKDLLPTEKLSTISKISIYSQKSKCIDFFNKTLAMDDFSHEDKGKYILDSHRIKSALNMSKDIIKFFDRLFIEFPRLYNSLRGSFGRISSVKREDNTHYPTPFLSSRIGKGEYQYPHGFVYPLVCGLTSLMEYDQNRDELYWKIDPKIINLNKLDLSQYVELIKMANYDPQKIGKGIVFYNEAENIFRKIK